MPTDHDNQLEEKALRPLTRQELDQRIQTVAGAIASPASFDHQSEISAEQAWEPRWISAAELVRRMQPYVVYN